MGETEFIEPQDPLIGQTIGGEFTLLKKVGFGGMGAVYRATQRVTERSVAVKVLHGHLADAVFVKRFSQEARIIASLNHPNIVTIYKYGQDENRRLFIAMEYVEGSDLADLIVPEWFFEVSRALPLMIQMAEALAYAHDKKIIHRDIKPENMILTKRSRNEMIKILDFGVAKILGDGSIRTKTGALCGSPPFMSPEQWQQVRDIDGRSDIYSLGCVFYKMVTGTAPFHSDTTVGYMKAHLRGEPQSPLVFSESLADSPQVADIIGRCIQRDRNNRYPDAYGLVEALREVEKVTSTLPRRPSSGRLVSASPLPSSVFQSPTREISTDALPTAHGSDSAIQTIPFESPNGREGLASSSENLPSQSSGTNLGLPPSRSRLPAVASISSSNHGTLSPPPSQSSSGLLRVHSGQMAPAASTTSDDIKAGKRTHLIFVVAGALLLALLALSSLYFWMTGSANPSQSEDQERQAPDQVEPRPELEGTLWNNERRDLPAGDRQNHFSTGHGRLGDEGDA